MRLINILMMLMAINSFCAHSVSYKAWKVITVTNEYKWKAENAKCKSLVFELRIRLHDLLGNRVQVSSAYDEASCSYRDV